MRAKRGGRWIPIGYRELAEQVQDFSLGLLELGVRRGDRVAILSENRPEWAITDYGCLAARAADVPIYPTLPARQAEYILRDSGAVAVVVSTAAQLEKVRSVRTRLPGLAHVMDLLGIEDGAETPELAASALEFSLEGLFLNRRISKDDGTDGGIVYGGG